jgi:hypothetical protein
MMFSSIILPRDWEERVTGKIHARDESLRIRDERDRVKERLRRLGLAFVDGLYDEVEYRRLKQSLTSQLETLVIPEVDAAREAGLLLKDIPQLWAHATLTERHRLVTTVLDAVYIDLRHGGRVVSIKLKPSFSELIQFAAPTGKRT